MKDKKTAEQFRSASASTRTKRQRKTMEEVPTEGMDRNLQDDYRKSHELQGSGRGLWHFTHSYEANQKEWAKVDKAMGEGREKGYIKNCA